MTLFVTLEFFVVLVLEVDVCCPLALPFFLLPFTRTKNLGLLLASTGLTALSRVTDLGASEINRRTFY